MKKKRKAHLELEWSCSHTKDGKEFTAEKHTLTGDYPIRRARAWLELNIYKFYVANVLYRRRLLAIPYLLFAARFRLFCTHIFRPKKHRKIQHLLIIIVVVVSILLPSTLHCSLYAAMRTYDTYDCVTFYLVLCVLATCTRQINFLSCRKGFLFLLLFPSPTTTHHRPPRKSPTHLHLK